MFLKVKGPIHSVMPLFAVNTELRYSGFETVWLFDDLLIPSTKHMPCASIRTLEHAVVASITNVGQDAASPPQSMEVARLARAAAEHRLRVCDFEAGSKVDVTFTSDQRECAKCGAVTHELQRAIFHPADQPGAPGLALVKSKIGRYVSGLIAEALRWNSPSLGRICSVCRSEQTAIRSPGSNVTRTIGGIELSKLAAFELLRHSTTNWYVL